MLEIIFVIFLFIIKCNVCYKTSYMLEIVFVISLVLFLKAVFYKRNIIHDRNTFVLNYYEYYSQFRYSSRFHPL